MSFWLKVRSAIRAGNELVPSKPVTESVEPRREPVVLPVPDPVVVPQPPDPQDTPEQAEADARRYIAQVLPLATLIGRTEGTDRGRGYDETLGYGAFDPKGYLPVTRQNLLTLDAFQTAMLGHPKNTLNSSAVGRFQFIRTTLRLLRKKWSIAGESVFDHGLQDDLFYITLVGRGLARWRKGELSEDDFVNALSAEWASLPNTKGTGTYKGQHTGCTLADLRAVLAQIK